MMQSLGSTKWANLDVSNKPEQKGAVRMYGQLLGYGDFRCYDLGHGGISHQADRRIYANFRNPHGNFEASHVFGGRPGGNTPGVKIDRAE